MTPSKPSFLLADLEIIGFASTLETPTLPRVLAPVFRVFTGADRNCVLLPPFSIQADEIWKAHESQMSEFDELASKEKLTKLDKPIQAKVDHELWVNPEGGVAYESKTAVKKSFERLYKDHLALAETKLANKEYENACRHAAVARAVDPWKLAPLIIRGVAERSLGETSRYEFTRHIAEDLVKPAKFEQLIWDRMASGGASAPRSKGEHSIRGISNESSLQHQLALPSSHFIQSKPEREIEVRCAGVEAKDLQPLLTKAIAYWSDNDNSLLPDLCQIQNLHREMFEGYLREGEPGNLKVVANYVHSERGFVHFTSPVHVKSDYEKLYAQALALKEKLNPQPVPNPDPRNDEHWPSDDDHQAWIDRAHYVAYFHAHLIHISPFSDGNGRVSRLIAWEQARRLFRSVCQKGYDWKVVDEKDNPLFLYGEYDGNARQAYKNALSKFNFMNINYHLLMRYFMFQPDVPLPHHVSLPAFKPTYHEAQVLRNGRPGAPYPPRAE